MYEHVSPLQALLQKYVPELPSQLSNLNQVTFEKREPSSVAAETEFIKKKFSKSFGQPLVFAAKGGIRQPKALRIGVVLSGGQASGGHNVIAGLFDALKKLSASSRLFGFLDGPSGIVSGKYKEIDAAILSSYRNQGGFDLLGSGRTKIETEEQLAASLKTVQELSLDGLVVIGGDDSNTNAAVLSEYFQTHGSLVSVIGVPKTIDGDLQNEQVAISFGFDSACKVYAEMIGNIERDALSAKKYYHFIKLMGRSASHITLECALATRPNYALMGEEIAEAKWTLSQITNDLCDMIVKRSELGKNYGVILIPEGLIEFVPEIGVLIKEINKLLGDKGNMGIADILESLTPASKACFNSFPESIQKQMLLGRDPHGNVQLSLIETERLLIETVSKELEVRRERGQYKGKFNPLQHFFGYEGRAGMPSYFDAHYCYSLGHAAALLLDEGLTSYMCFVRHLTSPVAEWEVGGVPLTSLMTVEVRHGKEKPVIRKALLNMKGKAFSHFKREREKWKYEDNYRFPGPTQYFGVAEIKECVPLTLKLEEG